jgi:hypothetical protein
MTARHCPQRLEITVNVEGARGNREIEEMVTAGVSGALQHYDRLVAPRTLARVSPRPTAEGLMALTYPLSFTQFLGALRVEEVTFRLSHPQEHTRLGDGTVISASLGASLWTGSIRLAQANHPRHAADGGPDRAAGSTGRHVPLPRPAVSRPGQ